MGWQPGRMYFGGDYNPEQWDSSVWREDVAIMSDMGINLVTLGVFSWSMLEPQEDTFRFDWLDDVMGLLNESAIRIDLATATASPPATASTPATAPAIVKLPAPAAATAPCACA